VFNFEWLMLNIMSVAELNNLLVSHSEYLQPFAITLTKDRETAKDLCQETIYRALINVEKYQAGSNLKSWLYTIMRNIFINDYRKKKRQPLASGDESLLLYRIDVSQTGSAYNKLAKKEIDQVISLLPPIFRMSFLLYVEGYKYNEIAEMLNEPLGTIKSRIHFARKTLQKKIQRN
jgi:RNA polymerase sigma factor (sigma-70 family)